MTQISDQNFRSCLAATNAHQKISACLLSRGDNLFSAGADGTVSIFRWEDGSLISSFRPHDNAIRGIVFYEDLTISGSTDGSVKVWRNGNFDVPLYTLIESAFVAWQIASVEGKLAAAYRKTEAEQVVIGVWDLAELARALER
jgi:WD40 repeat protein